MWRPQPVRRDSMKTDDWDVYYERGLERQRPLYIVYCLLELNMLCIFFGGERRLLLSWAKVGS